MTRATSRTRVAAKSSDTVLLKLRDSVVPHTVRLPDAGFRLWGPAAILHFSRRQILSGSKRRPPAPKCPCAGTDGAIYLVRCPGLDEERGQPEAAPMERREDTMASTPMASAAPALVEMWVGPKITSPRLWTRKWVA